MNTETKRPKYNIGELVYSYQNKKVPAQINKCEFRPWISSDTPHDNDNYAYKLTLPDGLSKWINEESLSLTPQ